MSPPARGQRTADGSRTSRQLGGSRPPARSAMRGFQGERPGENARQRRHVRRFDPVSPTEHRRLSARQHASMLLDRPYRGSRRRVEWPGRTRRARPTLRLRCERLDPRRGMCPRASGLVGGELADRSASSAGGWIRRGDGGKPASAGAAFSPPRKCVRREPGLPRRADMRCHVVAALRARARERRDHRREHRGSPVVERNARGNAPVAASRAERWAREPLNPAHARPHAGRARDGLQRRPHSAPSNSSTSRARL